MVISSPIIDPLPTIEQTSPHQEVQGSEPQPLVQETQQPSDQEPPEPKAIVDYKVSYEMKMRQNEERKKLIDDQIAKSNLAWAESKNQWKK